MKFKQFYWVFCNETCIRKKKNSPIDSTISNSKFGLWQVQHFHHSPLKEQIQKFKSILLSTFECMMKRKWIITVLSEQKYRNSWCHIKNANQFQPKSNGTCWSLKCETNAGVLILQVIEFVDKKLFRICRSDCTQTIDCGICVTNECTSTYDE